MASSITAPVKIAIVGVGLIGPRHARTAASCNKTALVAIVDPAPGGEHLAAELGVPHYRSVADMVQQTSSTPAIRPDGAVICTPNHTHVAVAKELSTAGIHVLVEKPVSADIATGRELVAHLRDVTPNVKTLVGHHRRFNPYMVATKKIVSSGVLGNLLAINGLWATYKPSDYFNPPTQWRRDATGGVVLINLVHEVDLLHYLFGPIAQVHAEKTTSQRGFEAEEGGALTLRFRSGMVGTFIISDHAPSPYNFEAGTGENPLIPKTGQDFYRIFGTEASLSVPDLTLWSYKPNNQQETIVKSWNSELQKQVSQITDDRPPFALQLQHFSRVIRGEEAPSCTAEAGLAALIVCQAIKDALKGNTTVVMEEYSL